MSSYKPIADAKAIAHLDWTLLCQIHLHGYAADGSPTGALEPPCTEKAAMLFTYHSVANCAVVEEFCCIRHFKAIYGDMSGHRSKCPVCGAHRFRSARPL
jgi:hypothetical protein